jgi:hypothetical protein
MREAKICDNGVALFVEHNILGLKITVDNAKAVQVPNSQSNLRGEKPGLIRAKRFDLIEVIS